MPETIEYRIQRLEEADKKNIEVHDKFYAKFNELAIAKALQDEHYMQIISKLEVLSADVARINQVPVKRVNDFVKSIVTAVGGAVGAGVIYAIVQAVSGG